MLLWSYFAAVTTDPGRVPAGWHPFANDEVALLKFQDLRHFYAAIVIILLAQG